VHAGRGTGPAGQEVTLRPVSLCAAAVLLVASLVAAEDVTEPRTGVKFPGQIGDMKLMGAGVRTRTFLKVKVYAIAFYAAEASVRGKSGAALYQEAVWGDFPKQIVLHFVRDVTTEQVQAAFRESLVLAGADKAKIEAFVGHFGETKEGQRYVLKWAPGGVIEATINGVVKPPVADKPFAGAVFAIWLGDRPIQEDIKKDLVARVPKG
jgi:hypothetical protein